MVRTTGPGSGRVLLVEDDADVRWISRAGLERFGYSVDEACGCGAALGRLADVERHYAAVVLDLCLPDGDGASVADHVMRTRPGTAVVVASGSRTDRLPSSIAVVRKPYTPRTLADAVLHAIEAAAPPGTTRRVAPPPDEG
jgi:two-component system, cell cycle sensor histidine kinase and response regulator CckA